MSKKKAMFFKGTSGVETAFISTWETTATNETITLPTSTSETRVYNCTVEWGDGNSDVYNGFANTITMTHIYTDIGTYDITIDGVAFAGLNFSNISPTKSKIKEIKNWGVMSWDFLNFYGCINMDITATDVPDFSSNNALDFIDLFRNCASITDIPRIDEWNTVYITNFDSAFRDVRANLNVSTWDTSNVTNAQFMFLNSGSNFNQNLAGWDISKITTFTLFNTNGTGWSTANYDATLISWGGQVPKSNVTFDAGNAKYTLGGAAEAARLVLTGTYGWTINDGGGI